MIEVDAILNASEVEFLAKTEKFLTSHGIPSDSYKITNQCTSLSHFENTALKVQLVYKKATDGGYADCEVQFSLKDESTVLEVKFLEALEFLCMLLTEGYVGLASVISPGASIKDLRAKLRFLPEGCLLSEVAAEQEGEFIAPAMKPGGYLHFMVDRSHTIRPVSRSPHMSTLVLFLASSRHADRLNLLSEISKNPS